MTTNSTIWRCYMPDYVVELRTYLELQKSTEYIEKELRYLRAIEHLDNHIKHLNYDTKR